MVFKDFAGHQARDGEVKKLVEALKSAMNFIDELKNHGIKDWSDEALCREALKPYADKTDKP